MRTVSHNSEVSCLPCVVVVFFPPKPLLNVQTPLRVCGLGTHVKRMKVRGEQKNKGCELKDSGIISPFQTASYLWIIRRLAVKSHSALCVSLTDWE